MRIELYEGLRSPAALAAALGATVKAVGDPPPAVTGIATDSREVRKGDLFVALAGEHTDGARFIGDALWRGAAAILSRPDAPAPCGDFWHFAVVSPEKALLDAAMRRRRESGAFVIAVTGSSGKTTVKEAIAALLGAAHSEGNYNSTLGMPLSVLSFPDAPCWVAELGINHAGEMEPMARALAPDLAVITNVGTAHIGLFGGREILIEEKCKIAAGVKEGGALLLPDDLQIPTFLAPFGGIFRVGTTDAADFRAENIVMGQKGVCCDLRGRGRVITNLAWPIPGRVGVSVIALVGVVGILLDRTDDEIRAGLLRAGAATPRMRQVSLGNALLLDDTYNASPESMIAALEILGYLAGDRPCVAVLGDMLELGDFTRSLHEAVGKNAAGAGLSALYTYGKAAAALADGAENKGMPSERIRRFAPGEEGALAEALSPLTRRPCAILFKASHAMRLDRVVRILEGSDEK